MAITRTRILLNNRLYTFHNLNFNRTMINWLRTGDVMASKLTGMLFNINVNSSHSHTVLTFSPPVIKCGPEPSHTNYISKTSTMRYTYAYKMSSQRVHREDLTYPTQSGPRFPKSPWAYSFCVDLTPAVRLLIYHYRDRGGNPSAVR